MKKQKNSRNGKEIRDHELITKRKRKEKERRNTKKRRTWERIETKSER